MSKNTRIVARNTSPDERKHIVNSELFHKTSKVQWKDSHQKTEVRWTQVSSPKASLYNENPIITKQKEEEDVLPT